MLLHESVINKDSVNDQVDVLNTCACSCKLIRYIHVFRTTKVDFSVRLVHLFRFVLK